MSRNRLIPVRHLKNYPLPWIDLKKADWVLENWPENLENDYFAVSQLLLHLHELQEKMHQGSFNRLIFNVQHRAVEGVDVNLQTVLFPYYNAPSGRKLQKLRLFNKLLNREQQTAVKHILARSSDPAPYLLSGPPCTGKTVTLAEAIKQLQRTSVNILACAHLNRAADLLCTEILKDNRGKNRVFRFYCLSHPVEKIPAELQRHCNLEDNMIVIPSIEELMQYQVIVSTLVNVSRLVTGGLHRGHFSSIFVDDAGQVAETECIIPLADLLDPQWGQVVLAGDPKQLGYTNTANLVKKHGIDESLMERLMKRDLYHRLNRRFITDLQKNYRWS